MKSVDRETLLEVVGILQPSSDLDMLENDDSINIDEYSNRLREALEDDTVSEEVKDAIRDIFQYDIVDPLNAIRSFLEKGTYNKFIIKEELTKDYKINDTSVGITTVTLKGTKGVIEGSAAVQAARASLGIRDNKKITLFRSGFWIAIGDISVSDIVSLEKSLTDVTVEVRESMLGLEYTTDVFIYLEVIKDFIIQHTIGSSLDVPYEELSKYIKMADVDLLYAGIIDSIEPRGFTNYFKCVNVVKVEESDIKEEESKESIEKTIEFKTGAKLVCDATFSARLRLNSILRVAPNRLTSKQRLMLLMKNGAVSLDMLKEYQKEFESKSKTITIDDDDVSLTLELKPANIEDIILMGKYSFDRISKALNKLSVGEEPNIRNSNYKEHYNNQALSIFAPYIKVYNITEDAKVEDLETISDVLAEVTSNDVLSSKISSAITEYIDSTIIAIFAVAAFKCESCKKIYTEGEETKKDFEGLIPINIRKYFFTLLTLRG